MISMITEICQYLKNWFNRKPTGGDMPKYNGKITIAGGSVIFEEGGFSLVENQYFRILGSLFNDGVHQYLDPEDVLRDEAFEGTVWSMALPPEIVKLSGEIDAWQKANGGVNSLAMSPFTSESFGGYSYSKLPMDSSGNGWQAAYAARLRPYKKM